MSYFLQKLNKDFIKVSSSDIIISFNFLPSCFLFLILLEEEKSYLSPINIISSKSLFSSEELSLFFSFSLQETKKLSKSNTPFNKVGFFLAPEYKLVRTSFFIKAIFVIRFSLIFFKLFEKISISQNSL